MLFLLQFGRLERVEVGGTKGKALTNAIKQVHADFLVAHGKFQEVSLPGLRSQAWSAGSRGFSFTQQWLR